MKNANRLTGSPAHLPAVPLWGPKLGHVFLVPGFLGLSRIHKGLIWLQRTKLEIILRPVCANGFFFISTFISQGVHLLDQIAKLLPSAS